MCQRAGDAAARHEARHAASVPFRRHADVAAPRYRWMPFLRRVFVIAMEISSLLQR